MARLLLVAEVPFHYVVMRRQCKHSSSTQCAEAANSMLASWRRKVLHQKTCQQRIHKRSQAQYSFPLHGGHSPVFCMEFSPDCILRIAGICTAHCRHLATARQHAISSAIGTSLANGPIYPKGHLPKGTSAQRDICPSSSWAGDRWHITELD